MKFKIVFGLFIVGIIVLYILILKYSPKVENPLIQKIEILESKIDSLKEQKDSIHKVIDSTHVKIVTNEIRHKEVVTHIINQSDSESYAFAREYIEKFINERFR